jgi:Ni/Co efflux regulator RcnB
MKKTISAIMLAALMVPGLAMAQPGGHDDHGNDRGGNHGGDRGGDHRGPGMRGPGMGMGMRGPGGRPDGWRQFRRGERFDQGRAWNYGDVDYRRYRGLRAPPRGYRWVRNGNDAVMVGIASGIVASVIVGAIR